MESDTKKKNAKQTWIGTGGAIDAAIRFNCVASPEPRTDVVQGHLLDEGGAVPEKKYSMLIPGTETRSIILK